MGIQSTLIAIGMRLTTLAFVLTALWVVLLNLAETKPMPQALTVRAQVNINTNKGKSGNRDHKQSISQRLPETSKGCRQCSEAIERRTRCDWKAEMEKRLDYYHSLYPSYTIVIVWWQKSKYTNAKTIGKPNEKICGWWMDVYGLKDCDHYFKMFDNGGWSNWSYMLTGDFEHINPCPYEWRECRIIKAKKDCPAENQPTNFFRQT